MDTKDSQGKVDEKKLMDLHVKMTELEQLELNRQREELPRSKTETEYRQFFEKEKELMLLIQDSIIVRANAKIEEISGYAVEELIGTEFMLYVHPDELPTIMEIYRDRMEGKEAPIVYETVIKHKNGEDIRIEAIAAKVTYHGNPADLVIVKKLNG